MKFHFLNNKIPPQAKALGQYVFTSNTPILFVAIRPAFVELLNCIYHAIGEFFQSVILTIRKIGIVVRDLPLKAVH